MTEYEKLSLLYLAHIAGCLNLLLELDMPRAASGMREELIRDIRKVASPETRKLLGDI